MLRKTQRTYAKASFLAVFFALLLAAGPARAQEGIMKRFGTAVDTVLKYMESIGRKTEEVLPPAFSLDDAISDTFSGYKTAVRNYDEVFKVPASPRVSVEGEFGEIRVVTWDQQVVRVQADITIGAETTEKAMGVANGVQVGVTEHEGGLDVKTPYPSDAPMEINYVVTVPRDTNLTCKNRFGDTIVHGVAGDVTVESIIGLVELKDLVKPVRVWAQGGSQPLYAYGLRQGGSFALQDVQAEFSNVAGTLSVNSLMGKVTLRDLAPECQVEVSSVNGPVEVQLSQTDRPYIEATALSGEIASDIEVERIVRSNLVHAKSLTADAKQRLRLDVSFDNVAVRVQGVPPTTVTAEATAGSSVDEPVAEKMFPVPQGGRLLIDAIVGDVQIEGTDGAELTVSATKHVRVNETANAPGALEALVLNPEQTGNDMRITTAVQKDLAALGCTSYRVDLVITCPKTMPVEVTAANGRTTVSGMAAPVKVTQAEGAVLAQGVAADVELHNAKGKVDALDCGGAVRIDAALGSVSTRNATGRQDITCKQGKVVIDAPLGELNVRSYNGDVNVIALNGVAGSFDIGVEQGDLSLMLLPTSDALLFLTTERGQVTVNNANGLVLTGTVGKDIQQFQGKMNNGQFRVALSAKDGNIAID